MSDQLYILKWNCHGQTLNQNLPYFLENDILTDVTLSVGTQHVRAHKIILAMCSVYFLQLFQVSACCCFLFWRLLSQRHCFLKHTKIYFCGRSSLYCSITEVMCAIIKKMCFGTEIKIFPFGMQSSNTCLLRNIFYYWLVNYILYFRWRYTEWRGK